MRGTISAKIADTAALVHRLSLPTLHETSEHWRDPRIDAPMAFAPAAVLIAITDRSRPGLVLTRRAETLRVHAGQVSFPGGRIDPGDEGPVDAALREAWEEIALPRHAVTPHAICGPYHTLGGYAVTGVIATIPADLPLIASPDEVESWFELPLDIAFDPTLMHERAYQWKDRTLSYRELHWNGYRIWGITAAMIALLAARFNHGGSTR